MCACVAVLVGCGELGIDGSSGDDGPSAAPEPGAVTVSPDAPPVDVVVMIGDSITVGARTALEAEFAEIGLPGALIEAENGKRMARSLEGNPSGASIAAFLGTGDPEQGGDGAHSDEVWVIALGTNDVGNYGRPEEIAGAVNEVLAKVPAESPLVWVDVYLPRRAEEAEQLNAILRERLERRGNSVIAPWSAFAGLDGVLTGDDVHPTPEGAEMFATVVADTVADFLGR